MEKVDLDKYLVRIDIETRGQVLDSPEDIAETERINKEMRKVVREYNYKAALSWQLARGLRLTR